MYRSKIIINIFSHNSTIIVCIIAYSGKIKTIQQRKNSFKFIPNFIFATKIMCIEMFCMQMHNLSSFILQSGFRQQLVSVKFQKPTLHIDIIFNICVQFVKRCAMHIVQCTIYSVHTCIKLCPQMYTNFWFCDIFKVFFTNCEEKFSYFRT